MKKLIFEIGNVEADILFNLQATDAGTTKDITDDIGSVLGWSAGNSAALYSALINGRKVKVEWGYRVRGHRDTAAAPTGEVLPYFRLGFSPTLSGPVDIVSANLDTDDNFVSVQRHMVLEMQFVNGLWRIFNQVSSAFGNNSTPTVDWKPLLINEATVSMTNPPNVNDCDGRFYFKFAGALTNVTLFMSYLRVSEYLE